MAGRGNSLMDFGASRDGHFEGLALIFITIPLTLACILFPPLIIILLVVAKLHENWSDGRRAAKAALPGRRAATTAAPVVGWPGLEVAAQTVARSTKIMEYRSNGETQRRGSHAYLGPQAGATGRAEPAEADKAVAAWNEPVEHHRSEGAGVGARAMTLTAWLATLEAVGIYDHTLMQQLAYYSISYLEDSAQLMGNGILVPAPQLTERRLMDIAARDGWVLNLEGRTDYYFLGHMLPEAMVSLLTPLTSPSRSRDPIRKMEADLKTLRQNGF